MIIACAPDRRFSELAGVLLASMITNGDVGDARIIVFGLDQRLREKERLRQSCGSDGDRLEFVDVDNEHPTLRWLGSLRPRISRAFFVRLLIPDILAKIDDQLLYLDCDMLVLSSLRPLLETDLGDYAVAAVPDSAPVHPARNNRFPFPADAPYFNSGLMLIDLAKWRERNFGEAVYDAIERENERLGWFDQDALNLALINQWKPLDREWNVHPDMALDLGGYDTARIIHFTGPRKPWSKECIHPKQRLYLQYREQTPWGPRRLETRLERRWRKIIEKRRKKLASLWKKRSLSPRNTVPQRPSTT